MTTPHTGTHGAKSPRGRRSIRPDTAMALLIQIDTTIPKLSRDERSEEWVDQLMLGKYQDLLIAHLKSTFYLVDSRLHPQRKVATVAEKAAVEKKRASTLASMRKTGARYFMAVGFLDFPMPNGKLFRNCTKNEAIKMGPQIGGMMNIIANLPGKGTDIIGKHIKTEAQAKKLAA